MHYRILMERNYSFNSKRTSNYSLEQSNFMFRKIFFVLLPLIITIMIYKKLIDNLIYEKFLYIKFIVKLKAIIFILCILPIREIRYILYFISFLTLHPKYGFPLRKICPLNRLVSWYLASGKFKSYTPPPVWNNIRGLF